jgi:hypothetical protein
MRMTSSSRRKSYPHSREGQHIFGEAGAAVTDAGIKKARTNARIGADAVADLIHVCSDTFADGGNGIDKGNFHREKSVAGVFGQLRALGAGHDDGRRDGGAVGLWNGVGTLIIGPTGERIVNFAQQLGRARVITADKNAVGKKKICDGGAFA